VAGAAAPDARALCSVRLEVARPRLEERCVLYEKVTGTRGTLSFPCIEGPAEARFGETAFAGELKGGAVELVFEDEYEWNDGCRWKATQKIHGTLAHKQLVYKYSEQPVRGTGCLDACTATSFVKVVEN
jgi:hypothetical protein